MASRNWRTVAEVMPNSRAATVFESSDISARIDEPAHVASFSARGSRRPRAPLHSQLFTP